MGNKSNKKQSLSPYALAHIQCTFNNTIVTITNMEGQVILSTSGGSVGFKGARRGTSYAAQVAAERAGQAAKEKGIQSLEVRVKGLGTGRFNAIKGLQSAGLSVTSIENVTAVAHNGCRPPKKRRI